MTLTLCLTAYNEAKNLAGAVEDLAAVMEMAHQEFAVVIVENGSQDDSRNLLRELAAVYPWLQIVELDENVNYGGGLLKAVEAATTEYVLLLSADRQYAPSDIASCIEEWKKRATPAHEQEFLVMGFRVERFDSLSALLVSKTYTKFCNALVGTRSRDVNAQPKILPAELVKRYKYLMERTFVLDAQLVALARREHLAVIAVPVRFLNRREGVSSWHGKRLRVYGDSLVRLWRFRRSLKSMSESPGGSLK